MTSEHFSKEEKEFIEEIEGVGLPDDYAEVALDELESPDSKAVKRIRQKTKRKLENPWRRRFFSKKIVGTAAVVLLAVLTSVAVIGPERVVGEIEELLKVVPGYGLQEEKDIDVALEEEVTVELDYMDLTVEKLESDGERTTLEIQIDDLDEEYYLSEDFIDRIRVGADTEEMKKETDEICPLMGPPPSETPHPLDERWPKLVDRQGNTVRANRWSPDHVITSGQTITQGGSFGFAPLEPGTSHVTLVLPDPREKGETVSIEVPLVGTDDLQDISIPSEPSETLHGVTLSANARTDADETQVTLAVEPESKLWEKRDFESRMGNFMLANRDAQFNDTIYTLQDDRGNEYSYRREHSAYYDYTHVNGKHVYLLSFDPITPEADHLEFKVSSLLTTEKVEEGVTLDLSDLKKSERDFVRLNEYITIGDQEIKITGLERLHNGLKVYFDKGASDNENLALLSSGLEDIRATMNYERKNGELEAIEFDFMDNKKFAEIAGDEVTMEVRAIVETLGPWELNIPLEDG